MTVSRGERDVKALEKAAEAICPQESFGIEGRVHTIRVDREGMARAAVLAFLDAVIEESEHERSIVAKDIVDQWVDGLRALRDEVANGS